MSGPNHADASQPPAALQAPWRMAYLEGMDAAEKKPAAGGGAGADGGRDGAKAGGTGSFLLDYWLAPQDDEKNHVIVRDGQGMVLLNRYPYANGHLLVALGDARPRLLDYAAEQRAALWGLVEVASAIMSRGLEPQGVNYGINEGRAAGAGVPQHLHVHLVPRWNGDVNFMSVVGHVRVIPGALEAMARRYRAAWAELQKA